MKSGFEEKHSRGAEKSRKAFGVTFSETQRAEGHLSGLAAKEADDRSRSAHPCPPPAGGRH